MASQTSGGGGGGRRRDRARGGGGSGRTKKKKGRVDATANESGAETEITDTKSEKSKPAVWTDEETHTLVKCLTEKKAAGGDGGFKSSVWHDISRCLLEEHPDGPKDHKQVKRKYAALKATMAAINKYKKTSGRHWDSLRGANIQTPSDKTAFEAYCKDHSGMSKFDVEGCEYYEAMVDLNPSSEARGDFAFAPGMVDESARTVDDSHHIEKGLADFNMEDTSNQEDAGGPEEDDTLIGKASTLSPSMKRKAMDPPESRPGTTSTGAPASSAASTAASTATSSKRRRANKVEGSSQQVVFQQLLHEQSHTSARIEHSLQMLNVDPVKDAQIKAGDIVKALPDLSPRQKVHLIRIFASQPRLVTSFLTVQDSVELQSVLIKDLLSMPELLHF